MDRCLLAVLLISLCGLGLTEDGTSEEGPEVPDGVPLVPLIPLIPSTSKEVSPTMADSEDVYRTTEPLVKSTSEEEELLIGGCGAYVSKAEAKLALADAIMTVGLELLDNMKTGPDQPNLIVSPLSVYLALSQLTLGAAGDTEDLLLRSLHADNLPCYHKLLRSLLQQLQNRNALQVAARMYLNPNLAVKSSFVDMSQHLYRSHPVPLTGLEEINEWVKNATKGQVTDFLSSLPPNLVLMLINAVHFKGEWLTRFDPRFTSSEQFFIDSEHFVNVDMMLGVKYPLSLIMDNELDAQIARFPFKDDMSLLVVLPTSGLVNVSTIAAKLNVSSLYERFGRERTMQVRLPKFKLQYSQELTEILTSMGLGELFSGPDLSRIADSPLLVSSVRHKSAVELKEEGAEASAATSVAISRSNPSFTVNQPFFFALMDDTTWTPVFLGVVTNPGPSDPHKIHELGDDKGYIDLSGILPK